MTFKVDQLVRHKTLGLGKVLAVEGDRADVFFRDSPGVRRMSIRGSGLETANEQGDLLLDNLDVSFITKSDPNRTYEGHQEAIRRFLRIFPDGFSDPKYLEDSERGERLYKWKAHELWRESLHQGEFRRLLAGDEFSEVVARASKVEVATNFLHPLERTAFWDAVKGPEQAEAFSVNLFQLIYGEDDFRERFEQFAAMLGRLPSLKISPIGWPVQTIFPFLAHPVDHIILRPVITQTATQRRGFELDYKPQLNWETYSRLLKFADLLKQDLAELKPRDMIDIQSFIFVTGDEKYPLD